MIDKIFFFGHENRNHTYRVCAVYNISLKKLRRKKFYITPKKEAGKGLLAIKARANV